MPDAAQYCRSDTAEVTEVVMLTRSEHLQWCKDRALEYVERGELNEAFASMAADLGKHPETENSREIHATLGMAQLMAGFLNTPAEMRKWINGFN